MQLLMRFRAQDIDTGKWYIITLTREVDSGEWSISQVLEAA